MTNDNLVIVTATEFGVLVHNPLLLDTKSIKKCKYSVIHKKYIKTKWMMLHKERMHSKKLFKNLKMRFKNSVGVQI